eukprot:7962317-Alexandrium_andersonii.AAC.1
MGCSRSTDEHRFAPSALGEKVVGRQLPHCEGTSLHGGAPTTNIHEHDAHLALAGVLPCCCIKRL